MISSIPYQPIQKATKRTVSRGVKSRVNRNIKQKILDTTYYAKVVHTSDKEL